jgi:basic membrane protein A
VIFKIAYSDSQEAAFCKQLGITQISSGADILFEVTGRCASGYIDAAYDAAGYAIGSNNDQAFVSPAVITSALKRVDRAVALTIQKLQNGQFKSGKQVFSLQDDATGFSMQGTITPPETIPPGV